MEKILIVGSGASGVHFALSVLKKGYEVIMLDVGASPSAPIRPEDTFQSLKTNLDDPVEYFLGRNYEAVILPGSKGEYYGFPPNKNYVFSRPSPFQYKSQGFEPLVSFARGGLAETWTAGAYPLNDRDLKEFPFSYHEMEPFYSEVARRIGITGVKDDLTRFYPVHESLMEPLRLDLHSERILASYEKHRSHLNQNLGCYLGRSRTATLSSNLNGRKACTYLGRCLWGCPSESLYTPSVTLKQCLEYPNFQYIPQMYVDHFKVRSQRVESVVARSLDSNGLHEIAADSLILAAGTLSSSKIFMDSIRHSTGEIVKLTGLMDNRQILMPFMNLSMIGQSYDPNQYQYHQLALGIEAGQPPDYFHALITTLKSALVHPIVQSIPLDLRSSISVFRNVRAGLGIINLNFPDSRRADNFLTLQTDDPSGFSKLMIHYSPAEHEKETLNRATRLVRKAFLKLGCVVPPATMHIRPMGASVHYAGTIPMSAERNAFTSNKFCRSHDFENLYFVDGTTFPVLPSKNLTFTLMANAIRVADQYF